MEAQTEIATFGTVRTVQSVTIRAEVTGMLVKAHFVKGQSLVKGQRLFDIDPRTYEAALKQAKANLARDTVLLENALRDAERMEALKERGYAALDETEKLRSAAEALRAAIAADQAAIDAAALQLERCVIACPIDGLAGDVLMDEGNLVKAADAALVTVNQLSPIEVHFAVPQADLATVRQRLAAGPLAVYARGPDQPPDAAQAGELTFIDNAIDPASGTVTLGATFQNKSGSLWPGQYVLVRLVVGVDPRAVVLPAGAVETGQKGKYVYVVDQGAAQLRPVTVTQRIAGDRVVIGSGLSGGEMVVVDGQLRLMPGAKVQAREDGAARPAGGASPPATASGAAK
jgi:multidrug efflux system membrane fusion protein